jgi:hypothetical protein
LQVPFWIEEAIHSMLALTLPTLRLIALPRLPITIHFSDEIVYPALKEIKPKEMEGTLHFGYDRTHAR